MKMRHISAIVCLTLATGTASSADVEAGKEVFQAKCIGCHAISCNRTGPKLEGIIGRQVGSVPDFEGYTDEMQSAGFVWSRDKLDEFLADPEAIIPGTLMASAENLEESADRENLIAFLGSGDTTLDLCF